MTTNEAAERLLSAIYMATAGSTHSDKYTIWQNRLDAALAAERRASLDEWENECKQRVRDERRATVERIRERINDHAARHGWRNVAAPTLFRILDEEAAR